MRSHQLTSLAGLAGVAAALLGAAPAALAQPANDTCATATPISAGTPTAGSTAGAGLEFDFSGTCQGDVADVWYAFTAPTAGPYEFVVSGASNSSLSLTLLSGCSFPMAIYGCTTGTGAGPARLEHLTYSDGETVYIRVGSLGGTQDFTVSAGPLPPPPNDTCAQPLPLSLDVPIHTHNLSATTAAELPMGGICSSIAPGIAGGADLYFSFTAPYDGHFNFSTCGSHIDTVVSVHTGCPVTEMNVVACNDNAPVSRCEGFDTYSSYLIGAELVGGQTYYVRVASVLPWNPFEGELSPPGRGPVSIVVQSGGPAPMPTNGTCATAEPVLNNSLAVGTTVNTPGGDAVCELGVEDYWGAWYSFTSTEPESSIVEFTVISGAFNNQATMTAVRGCGGEVITCQAFNPLTNPEMRITAEVAPGETIKLRVAGLPGTQGDFYLQTLTLGATPPNIDCAGAFPVTVGEPVAVDTTNAASSAESSCGNGLTDIYPLWYSFTPDVSGYYRLATDLPPGSPGATSLAVHSACGAASMACSIRGDGASENPAAAATSLYLEAGETVRMRVAQMYAGRGHFSLTATGPLPPPPPVGNDTCASAEVITSMPFEAEVDITLATPGPEVCHVQGQPLRPTPGAVWYRYTPQVDEVFLANVSTSPNYGGATAVFTGECGSLTQVGCPASFLGSSAVPLQAGVTYHILASASPNRGGDDLTTVPYGTNLIVSFISLPVPANDTCAGAAPITQSQAQFSVNTLPAGHDAPAPSCAGSAGLFSNAVWYTFRTTSAGTLTVEGRRAPGEHGGYSPAGALFHGECGSLVEVACGNPVQGFLVRDRFDFTVQLQAGVRYRLAVGSWSIPAGGETDITFNFTGGLAGACPADWNDDGAVNSNDISAFLASWLASLGAGDLIADFNGDGAVNSNDISAFLAAWLDAIGGGC